MQNLLCYIIVVDTQEHHKIRKNRLIGNKTGDKEKETGEKEMEKKGKTT